MLVDLWETNIRIKDMMNLLLTENNWLKWGVKISVLSIMKVCIYTFLDGMSLNLDIV